MADLPERVLVGYWHSWNTATAPFIPLSQVDDRYNVINISFVIATNANSGNGYLGDPDFLAMSFIHTGSGYSRAQLITDIATKRAAGKTVCLSVGGATGSFRLASTADRDVFITRMKDLIEEFGVDGIDIDLEQGGNVRMASGTINNPGDNHVPNMIYALQELLDWYQQEYGRKMILTMAPETVYVTGGLSAWQVDNINGGDYLPMIEALRDDIDLMMVQLYNSGSMLDLDGVERFQGTADFIVSQTEAIIRGFTAVRGMGVYSGLPASKVVVALPSCSGAGSGSVSTAVAASAINYIMGLGPKPGAYTLKQSGGYPDLRGMMTWSINNDRSNCTSGVTNSWAYAANFESIFGDLITSTNKTQDFETAPWGLYPNPSTESVSFLKNGIEADVLQITDITGSLIKEWKAEALMSGDVIRLDLNEIPAGLYLVQVQTAEGMSVKQLVKE